MKSVSTFSRHKVAPRREEARQARKAAQALAGTKSSSRRSRFLRMMRGSAESQSVEVPERAFRLFVEILNQMGQGKTVSVIPAHEELTTQQGAELLGVSRPYFVKLLETGLIPHHRVGSRRRVRMEHLIKYAEKVKGDSRDALGRLATQAQELGMGY